MLQEKPRVAHFPRSLVPVQRKGFVLLALALLVSTWLSASRNVATTGSPSSRRQTGWVGSPMMSSTRDSLSQCPPCMFYRITLILSYLLPRSMVGGISDLFPKYRSGEPILPRIHSASSLMRNSHSDLYNG